VVVERKGEIERYSADVVVVAAGAINSAALLLRSASDRHPNGLANGSDVVGRHLMMHNNSALIAFSKEPNPTRFEKTLGINDYYFGDRDSAHPLGHIQMLGKSDAWGLSFDAQPGEDPEDLAAHSLDFWLTTEDLPLRENRVIADADGGISLRYTPSNLSAHEQLTERLKGLLGAMRCHGEIRRNRAYLGGRLDISGVAHQNGTIRFGHDPATSALDVDCKAHEVDNLYVADASVFCSSSSVNPTLTIIANALRVADRIAERLGVQAGETVEQVA
jgi:choline dehydrogenase-like flavoprotein